MSSWRAVITVREVGIRLVWEPKGRMDRMFMCFNERWNGIWTHRSKLKHAKRVRCNEMICLTTTNDYIPITEVREGNGDNYTAIAVGL